MCLMSSREGVWVEMSRRGGTECSKTVLSSQTGGGNGELIEELTDIHALRT